MVKFKFKKPKEKPFTPPTIERGLAFIDLLDTQKRKRRLVDGFTGTEQVYTWRDQYGSMWTAGFLIDQFEKKLFLLTKMDEDEKDKRITDTSGSTI
jgi:hypothetical protein